MAKMSPRDSRRLHRLVKIIENTPVAMFCSLWTLRPRITGAPHLSCGALRRGALNSGLYVTGAALHLPQTGPSAP
eukprot:6201548-Pleurochrysis_carterae.AAC.2